MVAIIRVQEKEAPMPIAEIIPAVRALSRGEKFQLAQLLLAGLASEEPSAIFKEGQVVFDLPIQLKLISVLWQESVQLPLH